MSLFHIKTSPVADFTGTVTVFDSNGGTKTAAASDIVLPSDWNSAHSQVITLTGNTAGNSTVAGTNIVWQGGNNVTLSGNGATIVVSAAAGGAGDGGNIIAAGGSTANSTGTIVFSNSNNVSFGLNGGTVTATATFAQSADTNKAGVGFTSTTTAGTAVVGTLNTAGLSLGVPAYLTTAQPVGAYLTTARASNDAVGLNTALTAGPLAWTVNSNGISLNAGSAAGTTSGFGGNLISGSMTHNTAGLNLSLNHPAWLTTAAQSNHSHGFSASGGSSAFQTLNFANSNGITFSNSNGSVIASHNGLTTARASNDGIGLNTAQTNVTWTVNSSGLSLNAAGYAGTATTFNGTNVSGSMTLNSAGLRLDLSGQGGGVINQTGPNIAAGTQTATSGTVVFSNSNGITFGMSNSSVVTASHNGLTTAAASDHSHGNPTLNLTNLSGTTASNSAGFTLSLSAAAPGGGAAVSQYWACPPWAGPTAALITNVTAINNRPFFMPFKVQGTLSAQELMWLMSRSTSGSNAFTVDLGVYGYSNSSVISLITSGQNAYSQTDTASISGIRQFEFNMASFSLPPGDYILGMVMSATATASMNYSLIGATTANPAVGIVISGSNAYHTYTSHQAIPMEGRYTTTTGALPGTVSQNGIIGAFSGASMVLRPNWTLATHN